MGFLIRARVRFALTGVALLALTVAPLVLGEPGVAIGAARAEHYRIMESASSDGGLPLSLDLFSATVSAQSLELQLGFRNLGDAAIGATGLLTPDDYQLTDENSSRRVKTELVDPAISIASSLDGLAPEMVNSGAVTFASPGGLGPFSLRVSGFEPIRFSLDPARTIRPPASTQRIDIATDSVLNSSQDNIAPLALRVSRIDIGEQEIRFHLAFENSSDRRMQLPTRALSGKDAILIDGHLLRHSPGSIAPEFEGSIGPPEHSWAPGEQIAGTLTFPRPPPNALVSLEFSMLGFNSLALSFDAATGKYQTQVAAADDREGKGRADAEATPAPGRDGGLHEELTGCLQEQSDALNRQDETGFLARFSDSSAAKPSQKAFLDATNLAPVGSFRFKLSPVPPGSEPTTSQDGKRIDKVFAFMDYSIEGAAAKERFRSVLSCSFIRENTSSPWLIDAWEFTGNPPFWMHGLTERHLTEHFLIFYRKGPDAERILSLSCRQLEKAYTDLQGHAGLELGDRYLAFLVDEADQFESITGMGGAHIHGAAGSSYDLKGSEFTVLNRAMFINDESIGKQTWWGAARQQTITHELDQHVLSEDTRPFTPMWLVEGAAVHLTGQIDTRTRWALQRSGRLDTISLAALSMGEFPGHQRGSKELGQEYHYSGEAVRYLAKRFGQKRFLDYYRTFAKVSPAQLDAIWRKQAASDPQGQNTNPIGTVMRELTNQLAEEHFKADLDQLDKQVKAAIRDAR